ncbi:MAG: hypothetical protein ACM3MI_10325 [Clostridiales bacterium]
MKISSSFPLVNEELFIQRVLSNSASKFSWKHKIFYKYIRPVISSKIRHYINRIYNAKVRINENFIDDTLIEMLKKEIEYKDNIKNIYPFGAQSAIILTHDVEGKEGFDFIPNIMKLEEKYGFRSSWNIVPHQYKIDQGIVCLINEAGHEIGIHGYNHDGKLYLSKLIFDKRVPFINKALEIYGATGFRSPMVHHNLEWLQQLNISYDSSCFDYDPFQPFPDPLGVIWPFKAGKFIELPYTLPQDHTLFYILKSININYWKEKIKWLVNNNGIVLALTHPDYLKERKIIKHYEALLDYLHSVPNTWHCLPREIAEYWKLKYKN